MDEFIIDGNQYEGGGSILRVAVPIAVALGRPVTVYNIRKKRNKPGLRLQHLLGLKLMQDVVQGELEGGDIGSEKITLIPREYKEKEHELSIPTAGAITLVMQLVQNYVSASGNSVSCRFIGGGTHTAFSPTWEEIKYVTAFYFRRFGIEFEMNCNRVGFFPKGGARGFFRIQKSHGQASPVVIEEEEHNGNEKIEIISISSHKLKNAKVAERQIKGFKKFFPDTIDHVKYVNSDPGSAIIAIFQGKYKKGYSSLGERGIRAEEVGKSLAKRMQGDYRNNALDMFVSDQILVPLAFSPKGSKARVILTDHVRANLSVINDMLDERLAVKEITSTIVEVERI